MNPTDCPHEVQRISSDADPMTEFADAGARAEHLAELALCAPYYFDGREAVEAVEGLTDRLRLALLAQAAAMAREIRDAHLFYPVDDWPRDNAAPLAEYAEAVRPIHRELALRLADPEARRAHADEARRADAAHLRALLDSTLLADLEVTR